VPAVKREPWTYHGVRIEVAWNMRHFRWYAVLPSGATLRTETKKAMRKLVRDMREEGRA